MAWAVSTSPADINIISTWESDLPANSDNHKVPSILTYDGRGIVTSWGYKLEPRRHHIEWFKLLLSNQATDKLTKYQPDRLKKLQRLISDLKKRPVDVVADYLRCLWQHASKEISKKAQGLWEFAELKIVLTVPAIWELAAQELTKEAAKMAGLLDKGNTSLELVGEPEAAALSVFDEMTSQRWRKLKVRKLKLVI